jgi:hypothetical protein
MKWPKPPEQPPPPPVRIVGASRRGDFNFGMYANVEKQVAAMMEQGYWPLGLTFKDDFPVVFMMRADLARQGPQPPQQ